jgi:hypothetical protein
MRAILAYYNDNVAKALMNIFPEVAWEKSLYYQSMQVFSISLANSFLIFK